MKCLKCGSSDVSHWTASAGVEWKECNSCGEIFDKWDDSVSLDFIIVNKKPNSEFKPKGEKNEAKGEEDEC